MTGGTRHHTGRPVPTGPGRSGGPGDRVLLVRPWDSARQDAGCCAGATGGVCVEGWHPDPEQRRNRASRQPLGAVYRAVRAGLPDEVALEVVDPQNTLFLLPAVVRDARRHGLGWWASLRGLIQGSAYAAIIVNGRVVSSGTLPTPERALALIRAALSTSAKLNRPAPTGSRPPHSR